MSFLIIAPWGWLSSCLFAKYIRDLLYDLVNTTVGCKIGSLCINMLAYADYLIIMSTVMACSSVPYRCVDETYMSSNVCRTFCMIFIPRNISKDVALFKSI